jgi:hypothetical protein
VHGDHKGYGDRPGRLDHKGYEDRRDHADHKGFEGQSDLPDHGDLLARGDQLGPRGRFYRELSFAHWNLSLRECAISVARPLSSAL